MNPHSPAFQVFAEIAADFCRWCEGSSIGQSPEARAAVCLARLHAAVLALPEVNGGDEVGSPEIPGIQLRAAERNLGVFEGWHYRTVFDPSPDLDEATVMGDVGDDLLDVYRDVKVGSLLASQGHIEDAIWHWTFMHRVHWGRHALGALAALHARAASEE